MSIPLTKTTFSRISYKERVIIETRYTKDGFSMTQIAKELERPTSSITREIDGKPRKGNGRYTADRSQKKHDQRVHNQGRKQKIEELPKLKEYVIEKMKLGWSPEQISIRLPHDFRTNLDMRISYETIYQYIYNQFYRGGNGYMKKEGIDLRSLLPRRHKRRATKGTRKAQKQARIDILPSIELRPKEVDARKVLGHWEGDTVVSRQSLSRVKTVNERVSGIYLITKTPDGTSSSCNEALIKCLKDIPSEYCKTITQDRGVENMNYQHIEQSLGLTCYFAHPYSSHERGSNENTNGLLRRFFPKKTDWNNVTHEELKKVEYLLNSRPRVRLGGLTPYEFFYQRTGVALEP